MNYILLFFTNPLVLDIEVVGVLIAVIFLDFGVLLFSGDFCLSINIILYYILTAISVVTFLLSFSTTAFLIS